MSRSFVLDFADDAARHEIAAVGLDVRWVPSWIDGEITITESARRGIANVIVMVRPPTPHRCRASLADAHWPSVLAIVSAASELPHVLPLVRLGFAIVSDAVLRSAAWAGLSERQSRILERLEGGAPARVVARALSVSLATVKRDIAELYKLFHVHSRAQLVAVARAEGLLRNGSDGV